MSTPGDRHDPPANDSNPHVATDPHRRPRTVAIVGASRDRSKFGNRSVRAHLRAGFEVYPVNPRGGEIEGLTVYRTLAEVPVAELDRISMYVPPPTGLQLLPEIAQKGCRELWFNPGSESEELLERAHRLGLDPIVACSIVDAETGGR
jgi:predicted CoA-binding protein